ncbi:MAG: DUF1616 domain-containing protein [Methanoregula sp.]|jgi:uncharacterized membrane protein|uniref:DUF1616 domain-containing protein n=1 Tax=Methanoregula sp. TaxID=2052170 RepID=UPI003C234AC1
MLTIMEQQRHPYETVIEAFATPSLSPDLVVCTLWLAGAIGAISIPLVNETFLRVLLGVPVILFIPGYALIAALFPGAKDIDGIERVALSFGLSIAVVPLVGLALNYTPWGIRLDPIVVSLTLLTLCLCIVAQYRRARLPPGERFVVPFTALRKSVVAEFFPKEASRIDRALSVILLIAIVAAAATTAFVIVVPKEGEKFTEFFILGEKNMAADYPTRLAVGEPGKLSVGIGNHEYRNITYTVETYLVTMKFDEKTNTSSLQAMDLLNRFTVPVADNQTVITPYTFSAKKTGYNRIEFLLFNQTVPDSSVKGMARINRSYRDLHLWLTIYSG